MAVQSKLRPPDSWRRTFTSNSAGRWMGLGRCRRTRRWDPPAELLVLLLVALCAELLRGLLPLSLPLLFWPLLLLPELLPLLQRLRARSLPAGLLPPALMLYRLPGVALLLLLLP